MAILEDRKSRALDLIPNPHLTDPNISETFVDSAVAKSRVQDFAFSQGFAVVTLSHDQIRRILVLACTQHGSHTKNWRKTPLEDRKRINTKVSANDCPFRIRAIQKKDDTVWQISKLDLHHNHNMNPDPFQFNEHKDRDPDRETAILHAIGLQAAGTKYKQAQQVLLTHHVRLPAKTYWNLIRTNKLSPEDKIQVTLDTLESKRFHIRYLKKYSVEDNVRKRQVIEAFFFCSPE